MGPGLRARRVDDRVAERERVVVQHPARGGGALVVADRHAALEVVDEAAVPGGVVEIVGRRVVSGRASPRCRRSG